MSEWSGVWTQVVKPLSILLTFIKHFLGLELKNIFAKGWVNMCVKGRDEGNWLRLINVIPVLHFHSEPFFLPMKYASTFHEYKLWSLYLVLLTQHHFIHFIFLQCLTYSKKKSDNFLSLFLTFFMLLLLSYVWHK